MRINVMMEEVRDVIASNSTQVLFSSREANTLCATREHSLESGKKVTIIGWP